jgi:hypothetical protein
MKLSFFPAWVVGRQLTNNIDDIYPNANARCLDYVCAYPFLVEEGTDRICITIRKACRFSCYHFFRSLFV